MYRERIRNNLKIMKKIGNLFIEGQIVSLLIKGTLNAITVKKRAILNLNVESNQRVK